MIQPMAIAFSVYLGHICTWGFTLITRLELRFSVALGICNRFWSYKLVIKRKLWICYKLLSSKYMYIKGISHLSKWWPTARTHTCWSVGVELLGPSPMTQIRGPRDVQRVLTQPHTSCSTFTLPGPRWRCAEKNPEWPLLVHRAPWPLHLSHSWVSDPYWSANDGIAHDTLSLAQVGKPFNSQRAPYNLHLLWKILLDVGRT